MKKPLTCPLVNVGKRLDLECRAAGEPLPKITWFYKGAKIEEKNEDDKIEIRSKKSAGSLTTRTLTLSDVSRGDSGNYKCIAENDLGADYSECDLRVRSKGEEDLQLFMVHVKVIY